MSNLFHVLTIPVNTTLFFSEIIHGIIYHTKDTYNFLFLDGQKQKTISIFGRVNSTILN